MLTSGDLKSGDFLFCTVPRESQHTPLPTTLPTKLTYDLGHYNYEVLHEIFCECTVYM